MLERWHSWPNAYTEQFVLLLGFSAAALAPVAVRFESSVAGFLAVASAFYCAGDVPAHATW